MWVSLDDAIQIYAKALFARHREGARKVVLDSIEQLRAQKDWEGTKVWQRLATELTGIPITENKRPFGGWS